MFDYYKAMKMEENTFTENGAAVSKTSGNPLVDLNSKIPSLRDYASTHRNYDVLNTYTRSFRDALNYSPKYFYKWLLFLRDIRGGCGERDAFRYVAKWLITYDPGNFDKAIKSLGKESFAEYGRWDDVIKLMRFAYENNEKDIYRDLTSAFIAQLSIDIDNAKKNKPVSLLAKWLPKENTKDNDRELDYKFLMSKVFHNRKKSYRKVGSSLRKYLNVTEQKTSANEWKYIDYEAVPSKANLKYKNAFLKHDEERRRKYLSDVLNGNAKINSKALFLYEIVSKYLNYDWWSSGVKPLDESLEVMWKGIKPGKTFENTIVVRDGSGSMSSPLPKSKATVLDVATSLAIFCAENNSTPEYKDKFITFSSKPEIVDLSACKTLRDKISETFEHRDCSNTDIEKVFDLILNIAVKNKLTNEQLPKNILIISDMQFDVAHENRFAHNNSYRFLSNDYRGKRAEAETRLFDTIADKYKKAGYDLPKLIFWNCGMYNDATMPVTVNKNGVILMSGFSQNLVDMAMGDEKDPWEALKNKLDSDRYKVIDFVDFTYNGV